MLPGWRLATARRVPISPRSTFGRPADAAGLAISNSATSTDLTTLNNKYAAATSFTRSLDTTAEQAGYRGAASTAAGRAYLTLVTDNASYASATAPTALLESLNIACGFGPRSTYDGSTGVLNVNGKNLPALSGLNNDINVSKLTISGDGTPYTLTSANVGLASDTRFSIALNAADRAALLTRLTQNGDASVGAVAHNLAAADDWAMGVDPAINVADLTSNGIVVTNFIATLPQCAPGNWSASGTVPCDPASPGYYVNVVAATSPTSCAPGSYQSLPGQTSCNPADPGNYIDL